MSTLLEALSELKESTSKRKIAANILCLGIDEYNKDASAHWENFEVDSDMDVDSMISYILGHCRMSYGNTIVYLITDADTKETIYWEHQPSLYEETKSAVNEEAESADDEWKELTPEEAIEFSRWTRWCFSPDLNGGRNTRYIYDYLDSGYTFYGKGKGTKKLLKAVNKKNGSTIGPYGWDGRLNPELIDEELNEGYSNGRADFCTPVRFKRNYTYNGVEYEIEGSCMVSGKVGIRSYYSPATRWEPEESDTEICDIEDIDEIEDIEVDSIFRVGEEDPNEDLDAIADAIENELADELEIDADELEIDDNDIYWDRLQEDEPDYDDYDD